jgi:hypothetical protein
MTVWMLYVGVVPMQIGEVILGACELRIQYTFL